MNKIDLEKPKTAPAGISNLSKVGNKVKVGNTSGLASKTQYDTDKQNLEKRLNALIRRYLILLDK